MANNDPLDFSKTIESLKAKNEKERKLVSEMEQVNNFAISVRTDGNNYFKIECGGKQMFFKNEGKLREVILERVRITLEDHYNKIENSNEQK